jgi:DNA-binding transcriptional MerR regulator
MPDDLQPDEGQGDAGSPGIFDPYLQAVPEEHRDTVAGYLKDAEKNVNGQIQEAAELRKTFGPYKDIDLSNYDPETLNQLVTWHQRVSGDDGAYRQFIEAEAREMGITPAEAEEVIAAEDDGELTREQAQEMAQQVAEERLAPIREQLDGLQAEKATEIEFQAIESAFAQIQVKLGRELTKEERADIIDLGMPLATNDKGEELPMGDASWVTGGFERLEGLHATGSRLFLEQKTTVPGAALTAGGTPQLKPITSFKDANEAMRERLRQQS